MMAISRMNKKIWATKQLMDDLRGIINMQEDELKKLRDLLWRSYKVNGSDLGGENVRFLKDMSKVEIDFKWEKDRTKCILVVNTKPDKRFKRGYQAIQEEIKKLNS